MPAQLLKAASGVAETTYEKQRRLQAERAWYRNRARRMIAELTAAAPRTDEWRHDMNFRLQTLETSFAKFGTQLGQVLEKLDRGLPDPPAGRAARKSSSPRAEASPEAVHRKYRFIGASSARTAPHTPSRSIAAIPRAPYASQSASTEPPTADAPQAAQASSITEQESDELPDDTEQAKLDLQYVLQMDRALSEALGLQIGNTSSTSRDHTTSI